METYRDWNKRLIGQDIPDENQIVLVISGGVQTNGTKNPDETFDVQTSWREKYWLVGVGILLDDDNRDIVLNCTDVTVPFTTAGGVTENKTMYVAAKTRHYRDDWIFLWSEAPGVKVSESYREVHYVTSSVLYMPTDPDLGYSYPEGIQYCIYNKTTNYTGSIIVSPQVPATYYSTEDYNTLLGNAIEVAEPGNLHSFDSESKTLVQNYTWDSHRPNCLGGLSAGDISLGLSEDTNKHEMARIYIEKLIPGTSDTSSSYHQQVLDLAFFDFRSISASVYADQRTSKRGETLKKAPIRSVWSNLQENNTEVPKVVYFTEPLNFTLDSGSGGDEYFELEIQTPNSTYPVIGNVVFNVLTSRYVAKYTNAIVYCADNNTAYRTDANGIIVESYPERTYDNIESV